MTEMPMTADTPTPAAPEGPERVYVRPAETVGERVFAASLVSPEWLDKITPGSALAYVRADLHEAALARAEAAEAEAAALRQQASAAEAERDEAKAIIARCCNALPNGAYCAPDASLAFMAGVPDEVLGVTSGLVAEAEALRQQASAARREALEEAAIWHDAQDKALSKQPPSGDRGWRRSEHQEQAAALRAALAPPPREGGEP